MLLGMTKTEDRRSYKTERLGEVLGRVVAKLAAQRNRNAAAPEFGGESAAARLPGGGNDARGFEKGLTAGHADQARMELSAVIPDRAAEGPFAPRQSLSAISSK